MHADRNIMEVPHIGHLYSLVTADIFARFHRLTHPHQPVHFLTGTDEHGLKIQKAAREQGLSEKDFCDALSERFRVGSFTFLRSCRPDHLFNLLATGISRKG